MTEKETNSPSDGELCVTEQKIYNVIKRSLLDAGQTAYMKETIEFLQRPENTNLKQFIIDDEPIEFLSDKGLYDSEFYPALYEAEQSAGILSKIVVKMLHKQKDHSSRKAYLSAYESAEKQFKDQIESLKQEIKTLKNS